MRVAWIGRLFHQGLRCRCQEAGACYMYRPQSAGLCKIKEGNKTGRVLLKRTHDSKQILAARRMLSAGATFSVPDVRTVSC